MQTDIETIKVNGIDYVRANSVSAKPNGRRAVIVVDRGWVFAGDVTDEDGRIRLQRAVHVMSWQAVGFSGLIADPKGAKAVIKPCAPVDMPADAELFRVPVSDSWGL